MNQNRSRLTVVMVLSLLVGGLLMWWAGQTAAQTVKATFDPYNAALVKAGYTPMPVLTALFTPHKVNGQMYPKAFLSTGQPCGSNCLAQSAVKRARLLGRLPVTWGLYGGAGALLLGLLSAGTVFSPNPRRSMVNHQRDRVRLRTREDVLPIVQAGGRRWGIMRRDDLKDAGRRQFGNGVFLGAPGRGKSNLLKTWLLTAERLNFIVLDLKGDLWKSTAGYRATVGRVLRLDLTSLNGDGFDPLDTDDRAVVTSRLEIFLPTDEPRAAHFNRAAQEIAAAYWVAARVTQQSAVPVIVQAAVSSVEAMLDLARGLAATAPPQARDELLGAFAGAFGPVWTDPSAAAGGERGSVVQSFKSAFAALNTPEILSTLSRTTFQPADLVTEAATLYISAPSTEAPYRAPLELLMGAIIDEVFAYADRHGAGEEIVILADEAGALKIPRFADVLSTGRSRNVSMTAFLQSLGQLDQYHRSGWRGIVDTIHHWTFWATKDPAARDFLRDVCGEFDKPNPNRNPEERKRRPFVEVNAFDELAPRWRESEVLSVLDYDRIYPVFGKAVHPFRGPLKRRMRLTPPQLRTLLTRPPVKVAQHQAPTDRPTPPRRPPAASASQAPAPPAPEVLPTPRPSGDEPKRLSFDDDDETF